MRYHDLYAAQCGFNSRNASIAASDAALSPTEIRTNKRPTL
jgi:hypothetical protein